MTPQEKDQILYGIALQIAIQLKGPPPVTLMQPIGPAGHMMIDQTLAPYKELAAYIKSHL
jgi:hypothetical protein